MIPGWTNRESRIAYNAWVLERPQAVPPYPPEGVAYMDWPIFTWWARNPPITK